MLKHAQIPLFREQRKPRRGRPPKRGAGLPHTRRPAVDARHPHHVTVRVRRDTWNLRSQRSFSLIAAALAEVRKREGFRIAHFSVQGNHMHMLVEAHDRRTMSNGLRALLIRVARQLNLMMDRSGPRFVDRYHEHVLGTPTQVRNALRYVLGNHAVHLARLGKAPPHDADSYSSLVHPAVAAEAKSWLLRIGWQKAPDRGAPRPIRTRSPERDDERRSVRRRQLARARSASRAVHPRERACDLQR